MKKLFLLSLPLLTLMLTGCGGSSDSEQSTSDVVTDPVSENVQSRQMVDLSGQYPVTSEAQKSQKTPLFVRQASSNQQVDANISWPLESNSSNKNLRFRLTVSSDSEVSDIYLKWAESDEVYAICQSDCGSDFEASVIGLNPYLAGYSAGELELQVVVNLNTLEPTIAQRAFINWQPFSIETLAVERTEQALNIDWQGDTNFDRYNVYVAPIGNFAPNEIPTIEGAKQFLALTESTLTVGDINTDTTYYVLVTGVDDSGESGFSNIVRVNSTSTVNIQPPQAISDEFTVPEDEALVGNVLENDVASSAISVNLDAVTLPLNGELLIEADGEFEYQPAADFSGNDEFSYEVVDESGNRATATVSIEVAAVNDAPIAIDDEYELSESRTLDVVTPGVLNNDVDIDTDTESLEVTLVDEPEFGSVTLNEDGGFSYQANDNFDAEDSFSYSVFDGESTSSEATVVIKGPELNVAPTVVNDEYTLLEDTILAIEDVANGFLANDTDPEGDVLTLNSSLVSEPAHGELTVFDDGTFRYVPVANYFGSDSFTYELSDSAGNSAQGTVILKIDAVVDNPVANDDVYEALTGMTLSVVATEGLGANDINIDDLELEYQLASENDALVGSITIKSDGGLEYIPLDGFLGSDNFTYQILVDGIVVSTASVTIEVKPSLGLESLNLGTTEDINLSSNIFDSFANLSEGHSLTVVVSETSAATLGTFVINNNGDYSFEPSPNVSGSEVIEITIINAEQVTQKVSLTLTVTAVNDAPEVTLGALSVDEDGVLEGDLTAYVSDVESDTITFITTPKTNVTSGTLVINEAGTFTYTPSLNFFGVDSFEYEVQDSNGAKTTGTLNLTVNTINDLPTALDTVLNIAEDNVLAGDLTTLVSDVEGDTLTIDTAPVSPTSNGALSIASDGSFTYTPSLNFFGPDSFDYKVTDDKGGESTGTVTLTVTSVNDAPEVTLGALSVDEDGVLAGDLTAYVSDIESDTITFITTPKTNVTSGTLVINEAGTFTYTPSLNFFGVDSFEYEVQDSNGAKTTGTLNLTVNTINDLPTALDTVLNIAEDNVLAGDLTTLVSDVEGDTLTIDTAPVSPTSNGALSIASDGSFTYTPSLNFFGPDSFDYKVTDDKGGESTGTVTLTVTSVNDAPEVTLGALSVDEDDVLAGDLTAYVSDVESDTITFITTPKTNVTSGTLVINEAGTFTYTPSLNFFGVDSFEYEVQDSNGAKTTGTLNLTVNTINDLPTALDTVLNIAEDNVLAGDLTTLVSDVEGDTLTIDTAPVSPTSNGVLSIASDGSFTYTPSLNFFGSDSFDYKVTDDKGGESTGTVTLTVTSVNDAPLLSDTSLGSIAENVLGGFSIGTINATDVEGDDITYSLVGGDTSLFNIDSATGELTVNGADVFNFELSQSHVVTVRAQDNGTPAAEFTDAVISIGINNVVEAQVPVEDSSFGRGLTGFQDLNTTEVKGEFNATFEVAGKIYFAGYSNNVDEDIYVTSVDINGDLITSFGNNGVLELNLGGDERVIDITEGGGELYMVVEKRIDDFQELCVVKIDPSGNLDSAGGDNNSGIRCTTEDSELYAGSITYNSNKVYVVGHRDNGAELDSLFIKLDENSLDFEQSSPIYNDVSTNGLDDKAHEIKNFYSSELMIVGATKNSNGDWDAYVRYVNNIGVNDTGFNGGSDLVLTSIDNGGDDELLTLGGDSGGGFVAYLGGYTEQSLGSKDALLVAIDKDGLLNATFDTDGIAIYDLDGDGGAGTGSSVIHSINREFTTDKLMVIGNKTTGGDQQGFAMKVATADSALDFSYGPGTYGEFVLTDSESINVNDVVVDENYRAWFAGSFGTSSSQPYIRALNQDASIYGCFPNDFPSCGQPGKLVVDLSGNTAEDNAPALIKLNNGPHANKLLSVINVGTGLNAKVVLQRYTEIGTLDVTLGTNGMKQVYLGSNVLINGLVEQSDGNIVLFGRANTVAGETHGILARINQEGEIDETYGTNGIFYTDSIALTSDTQVKAVAIDSSNDKVVAVGETTYSASTRPFVMRVTPTGELDSNIDSFDGITSAFDTSGYIIDSSDKTFEAVGIDGNNKVIVAGSEDTGVTNFWLYRFNPDGSADNSFDGNGSLRITRVSYNDQVNKLLINSTNELYVLGYSNNITDDSYMVKVKNDGTLDTSFGSSGLLSFNNTKSGGVDSRIVDAAIDSQDRIVAIGIGENGSTLKGAINRITASGSLDTLFGVNSDGHYLDEQCAQEQSFTSMILNTDNQIIVTNQCQVGTTFDTSISLFNFYEEGLEP